MTESPLPSETAYLGSVFDGLIEPVLAFDPRTRQIVYSNSAAREVFKFDPAQPVDSPAAALFADETEAVRVLEAAIRSTLEHGYAVSQCRFRAADRTTFQSNLKLTALLHPRAGAGPAGLILFILGNGLELEQPPARPSDERAGGQSRRSETLSIISSLSRKITHDIASPLNGMHTAAQMLARLVQKNRLDAETLNSSIANLMSELDRLRSFLGELRQLGRPSDKQQQTAVDLRVLLAEAAGTEQEKCKAQGINLKLDAAPVPLIVEVDPGRIKQVFHNLCKNAREAMPQGGTLSLASYPSGADAVVEITDTGTGFDPDMDIYSAFSTTKPEAAGLGLTIALGIVEAYKGDITHASRPGGGATFRIALPLSKR